MKVISDDPKRRPLHEALLFAIKLHEYGVCVNTTAGTQVIGEIRHIMNSGITIRDGDQEMLLVWDEIDEVVVV